MGLLGIDAQSTSASDNRIAATDSAHVVKGSQQYTESGAISVGKGGKYQETGSLDMSANKGTFKTGGVDVGKLVNSDVSGAQAGGSIIVNDATTANKALDTVGATAAAALDNSAALAAQNAAANAAATGSISALAAQQNAAMLEAQKAQLKSQDTTTSTSASLLSQVLSNEADQSAKLNSTFATNLSSLAESQQTGGASELNKTILWIVLGVLGLLGLVFMSKR